MLQVFIAIATALGAAGGIAGLTGAVRVFVVDRHTVKREETTALWDENRRTRTDLDNEIAARREDRRIADAEVQGLREELRRVRDNWDICRAECQRLRGLIEGREGGTP